MGLIVVCPVSSGAGRISALATALVAATLTTSLGELTAVSTVSIAAAVTLRGEDGLLGDFSCLLRGETMRSAA